MSDSLADIKSLKRQLHIDEDFVFLNQIDESEMVPNDFCKIYFINLKNFTITLPDSEPGSLERAHLTVNEMKTFQNFSKSYRKWEYFFGRLLAKIAISECLAPLNIKIRFLDRIELSSETSKKPRFDISGWIPRSAELMLKMIDVSLSHKKNLIGSIASLSLPVGIDIETLQHFSPTLSKKIFKPSDLDEFNSFLKAKGWAITEDILETGIWCLKEATSKAIGLGLAINFRDFDIKYENGMLFVLYDKENHEYSADLIKKDDFFVGMVRKTS